MHTVQHIQPYQQRGSATVPPAPRLYPYGLVRYFSYRWYSAVLTAQVRSAREDTAATVMPQLLSQVRLTVRTVLTVLTVL